MNETVDTITNLLCSEKSRIFPLLSRTECGMWLNLELSINRIKAILKVLQTNQIHLQLVRTISEQNVSYATPLLPTLKTLVDLMISRIDKVSTQINFSLARLFEIMQSLAQVSNQNLALSKELYGAGYVELALRKRSVSDFEIKVSSEIRKLINHAKFSSLPEQKEGETYDKGVITSNNHVRNLLYYLTNKTEPGGIYYTYIIFYFYLEERVCFNIRRCP